MIYAFTVTVETDNIIGTKEHIAAALEAFGKVTFPAIDFVRSNDDEQQEIRAYYQMDLSHL